jgi:Domain of unknown function (DUF5655)/Endonuclease NucS
VPLFHLTRDEVRRVSESEISEEKLRGLFEKHGLAMIEAGLRFVDRNVGVRSGFIDTLALDAKNRPVVIEYKVDQGDTPSALVQALSYVNGVVEREADFDRLIRARAVGGVKGIEIDFDNPRIVLVAPGFDLQVIEAARQAAVSTLALEYKVYVAGNGHTFATSERFNSETSRRAAGGPKAYSLDYHFGTGGYRESKPIFEKLAATVKGLYRVDPTFRQYYIGFKDTGNLFGWAFAYAGGLVTLGVRLPPGEHPGFELAPKSWTDSYPRITHVAKLRDPANISKEVVAGIRKSHDASV